MDTLAKLVNGDVGGCADEDLALVYFCQVVNYCSGSYCLARTRWTLD